MKLFPESDLASGVIGGLILGASTSSFMFFTGRITGISGIFQSSIALTGEDNWPITYILGLISSGAVLKYFEIPGLGDSTTNLRLETLVAAGIITGFGTRIGSGCTSGHGLCGLSRFSIRSLVAVATFMSTGALTAFLSRQTPLKLLLTETSPITTPASVIPVLAVFCTAAAFLYKKQKKSIPELKERKTWNVIINHLATFALSNLFGVGLGISGMCNPERVLMFLDFTSQKGWDPTLIGVMGGGVIFNAIAFYSMYVSKSLKVHLAHEPELVCSKLKIGSVPENLRVDWKLVTGSALFGIGWGLAGVCPGPALVSLGALSQAATVFVPGLIGGIFFHELIFGSK